MSLDNKKRVIDLNEISKQLNVPVEDYTFTDGYKMSHPKWGKEHFNKARQSEI